jgi:hypothetical protein
MRFEYVEVPDCVAELVDVVADPDARRFGRDAKREAALTVDVERPEAELGVCLDDRGVVGEKGRVLDVEVHAIAVAGLGRRPREPARGL